MKPQPNIEPKYICYTDLRGITTFLHKQKNHKSVKIFYDMPSKLFANSQLGLQQCFLKILDFWHRNVLFASINK